MNTKFRDRLAALYNPRVLSNIVDLIDREGGFSLAGQTAFVQMLLEVQEYDDISPQSILSDCETIWTRVWQKQDPAVRGNPVAPGEAGIESTAALERFFLACGVVDSFLEGTPVEIPADPFNVVTMGTTYAFGSALNGFRTVSNKSKQLKFGRGKVSQLSLGKSVVVQYRRDGLPMLWYSDPVLSVER